MEKTNIIKYSRAFLLLFLYSFGYLVIDAYFKEFSINIFKYITLGDLLFMALNYLLQIFKISLIYFIAYIFVFLLLSIIVKPKTAKRISIIESIISIFIVLGSFLFSLYYGIEKSTFYLFPSIFLLLFIIFSKNSITYKVYVYKLFNIETESLNNNKTDFYSKYKSFYKYLPLGVYFLFLFTSTGIMKFKAENIKNGIKPFDNIDIEITYDQKTFATKNNKEIFYIGETYDYLFLYNRTSNSTVIMHKQNIKKYVIFTNESNNKIISNKIERIKNKIKNILSKNGG